MVQVHLGPPSIRLGGVAQLGEHLPCKQGVIGSIPFTSTNQTVKRRGGKKRRSLRFGVPNTFTAWPTGASF